MQRLRFLLFLVCLAAAALPLTPSVAPAAATAPLPAASEWPATYDGRPLRPLPLTDDELLYITGTPMRMARFSDGTREILFRRIEHGTRLLHSSAYCLRGAGFAVSTPELREDAQGRRWSRFTAHREGNQPATEVTVSERIEDPQGQAWTDVSAWYWAVLLERTQGPWMAVMIREGIPAARNN